MLARWLVAAVLVGACGGSAPAAPLTPAAPRPGALADTWLGNDATWHQVTGAHPAARYSAALAYDADRDDFVLFGGQSGSVSYDDTWTFDGKIWKLQAPAHKPSARRDPAMAYDPSLHRVVMYGGLIANSAEGIEAGDTWTWDGSDWTLVSTDNDGPHLRYGAGMVTAATHVILFGGHIFNTHYFSDAWTLAGHTWLRLDHGPAPAGRGNAAVAWNEDDSSLFVYGGLGIRAGAGPGNLGSPLTDAWSLKATTWAELTSPGPPALYDASAVWDSATHSVLILLGMSCPQPLDDQWAWNGTTWTHTKLPIPARWAAVAATNAKGEILVFGGSNESGC